MAQFAVSSVARLCAVLAPLWFVSTSGQAAELRPPSAVEPQAAPIAARHPDPGYTLLKLAQRHVKWGTAQSGTGAVIRYAFVTEPMERSGTANCTDIGPLHERLLQSTLTSIQFASEIRRAMAAWEAVADIRFAQARDQASADLLIGMQRTARGIAYADVVRSKGPRGATVPIRQAAICFNPELAWENQFDGDADTPDVRYVAAHELGHVLGLDHSWGAHRLMDFKYRETVRTPQRGDVAGAVRIYGPAKSNTERLAYQAPEAAPAIEPAAAAPREPSGHGIRR